jgi:hypothetical protein
LQPDSAAAGGSDSGARKQAREINHVQPVCEIFNFSLQPERRFFVLPKDGSRRQI